jgi:hypothetical protein
MESELLEFIKNKSFKEPDVSWRQLVLLYSKTIINAIQTTSSNFPNSPQFVFKCIDFVFYVFWLLYRFCFNTKLTLFLTEKAITLFNQYLSISLEKTSQIQYVNMITYIVNKTIGCLSFNFFNPYSKDIDICMRSCKLLNQHIVNIPIDNIPDFLLLFTDIYYRLHFANLQFSISIPSNDPIFLNSLRIQYEIFYYNLPISINQLNIPTKLISPNQSITDLLNSCK